MQFLEADWTVVAGYMYTALQEVAMELGGEEMLARVTTNGDDDSALPTAEIMEMLKDIDPDVVEKIFTRTSEIQQEAHRQQIKDLQRPTRYGKAILRGFTSFNIWPTARSKNRS